MSMNVGGSNEQVGLPPPNTGNINFNPEQTPVETPPETPPPAAGDIIVKYIKDKYGDDFFENLLIDIPKLVPPPPAGSLQGPDGTGNPWFKPNIMVALYMVISELTAVLSFAALKKNENWIKTMDLSLEMAEDIKELGLQAAQSDYDKEFANAMFSFAQAAVGGMNIGSRVKFRSSAKKQVDKDIEFKENRKNRDSEQLYKDEVNIINFKNQNRQDANVRDRQGIDPNDTSHYTPDQKAQLARLEQRRDDSKKNFEQSNRDWEEAVSKRGQNIDALTYQYSQVFTEGWAKMLTYSLEGGKSLVTREFQLDSDIDRAYMKQFETIAGLYRLFMDRQNEEREKFRSGVDGLWKFFQNIESEWTRSMTVNTRG